MNRGEKTNFALFRAAAFLCFADSTVQCVCRCWVILSKVNVRSHVTEAGRLQHSPELPEADHIPGVSYVILALKKKSVSLFLLQNTFQAG